MNNRYSLSHIRQMDFICCLGLRNHFILRCFFGILFCVQFAHAQPDSVFNYSTSENKKYEFIQQFKVHHRSYKDAQIKTFYESELKSNRGPDQQVVSMLSALKAANFNWWLKSFNESTLADWEKKSVLQKSKKEYAKWLDYIVKFDSIRLIHWYGVGDVIYIGFEIHYSSEAQKNQLIIYYL